VVRGKKWDSVLNARIRKGKRKERNCINGRRRQPAASFGAGTTDPEGLSKVTEEEVKGRQKGFAGEAV